MQLFETAETFNLPDARVFVAGDWHGSATWVQRLLPAMRRYDAQMQTILHLGDFWPHEKVLHACDFWAKKAGIERILVTPGNHEPWREWIVLEEDLAPGQAARVSESVWLLSRPFRFTIMGREVLSLGGASSVDQEMRVAGVDWWPEEVITDTHELAAIAGGPADVMLTHESPVEATPTVQRILSRNPGGWPASVLGISAAQRERVQRVWDGTEAQLLLHGHMHVEDERTLEDGRRVVSLACDEMQGNVGVLDLATLEFDVVNVP